MISSTRLNERYKAAIRLIVMGLSVTESARVHGISRQTISTAYNSEVGREYVAHLRHQINQYAAAMFALGLVPDDITRRRR